MIQTTTDPTRPGRAGSPRPTAKPPNLCIPVPSTSPDAMNTDFTPIIQRLDRIEAAVAALAAGSAARDWYTTEEFAKAVGKAEFTVREWCRHGRVSAEKQASGRGRHAAWAISHDELLRYRREGLRPQAGRSD